MTSQISTALARLEHWLETMRSPSGYGGAVVHWWQQSFMYTGTGRDWRYEGIIAGYLALWEYTGGKQWLNKARRAGDDLVAGQLENGHFAASAFELNPASAGTPHEAACDVGLLMLAQALRKAGNPDWEGYAACAERNLCAFYLAQLWDADAQSFRDDPHTPSFVPNKAATACEAFFLLAEIRQDARFVEQYALPNLKRIIEHQVSDGTRLDGAIAQNSFGSHEIKKYFPIYIARCVPALLRGYEWTNEERYLASAKAAMDFIARWLYDDGSLPTVVYANQHVNRYPSWVSPLADVLRAGGLLTSYGFSVDLSPMKTRLLAGQDSSGGFQTATGFAYQAAALLPRSEESKACFVRSEQELPDLRDVLHVVGWNDKVFRYLASQIVSELPTVVSEVAFETACTFRGQRMYFRETEALIEVRAGNEVRYRWYKGDSWPEIAKPEFWLR